MHFPPVETMMNQSHSMYKKTLHMQAQISSKDFDGALVGLATAVTACHRGLCELEGQS